MLVFENLRNVARDRLIINYVHNWRLEIIWIDFGNKYGASVHVVAEIFGIFAIIRYKYNSKYCIFLLSSSNNNEAKYAYEQSVDNLNNMQISQQYLRNKTVFRAERVQSKRYIFAEHNYADRKF